MASTASEYGYIVIGASKFFEGYRINGISRSFKIDGVIKAALKQLSYQPIVEFQMDSIESKNVCVICVKKSGRYIFVNNESSQDTNLNCSIDALLRAIFLACFKLQRSNLYKDVSEDERNDYIRDLLETSGYQVKDQTRQGNISFRKSFW